MVVEFVGESVMHGQCDARPTLTFRAAERHHLSTGTKLYCLVNRGTCANNLPRVITWQYTGPESIRGSFVHQSGQLPLTTTPHMFAVSCKTSSHDDCVLLMNELCGIIQARLGVRTLNE